VRAGIAAERIVVDPGFGFGKTLAHNLRLMKHLGRFRGLGVPLLVGVSRKSMIGAVTGRPVGERLAGGLALAALAVRPGRG
jgi:dihydropteroate synthase